MAGVTMGRDDSEKFALAATKAMAELANGLAAIKGNCSGDEYDSLSKKTASLVADIIMEILNPIYDSFPELEAAIDREVEIYLQKKSE